MKNKSILLLIAVLSMSLMASTCSNDDDGNGDNNQQIGQWENITETGTWKITLYSDDGDNETHHYEGYIFTFAATGQLTAVKGDETITGTWSITDDSNSNDDDDGNSGDIDFNIFFSAPQRFEELSDDWDIVSITNTKIELMDVSGGNGGTDHLTFSKN